MKTHTDEADGHYTALYYEDGWMEIRESDNRDAWVATDRPVEVLD